MPPADLFRLTELVAAGGMLVLTGAGVSTDSGIPDYRGPDGRRRHTAPMTFDRFRDSANERRRYWARSHLGWERVARARPNPAHHSVASFERAGLLVGTVTQNVDGLHSAAGSRHVIDLHGRLDAVVCLGCGLRRSRLEVGLRLDAVNPGFREALARDPAILRPDGDVSLREEAVEGFRTVDCRRCDGVLKPDVVFFGETVPRDRFRRALGMVEDAAALLVLGSSLAVGSGYRVVTAAARRGLPIAIVTRGPTRGDRHASLKIDAALSDVLQAASSALEQRTLLPTSIASMVAPAASSPGSDCEAPSSDLDLGWTISADSASKASGS